MTSRLSPSTIIVVHGEFIRDIIMRERERKRWGGRDWQGEGGGEGEEGIEERERGERKDGQINERNWWLNSAADNATAFHF